MLPSSTGAPEEGTAATLAIGDCRVVEAAYDGYLETALTSNYNWGGGNINTSNLSIHQQLFRCGRILVVQPGDDAGFVVSCHLRPDRFRAGDLSERLDGRPGC